jgi:hypothetical protein
LYLIDAVTGDTVASLQKMRKIMFDKPWAALLVLAIVMSCGSEKKVETPSSASAAPPLPN